MASNECAMDNNNYGIFLLSTVLRGTSTSMNSQMSERVSFAHVNSATYYDAPEPGKVCHGFQISPLNETNCYFYWKSVHTSSSHAVGHQPKSNT